MQIGSVKSAYSNFNTIIIMANYIQKSINFALSSIIKDLNSVEITDKASVKESAKETIREMEKFGYNAVFKLDKTTYTVLAYDLNTLEKMWKIENNESIKDLMRKGDIDFVSFCKGGYEFSVLIANYELEIDYETGIITATGEYEGDFYTVYFENGKEESSDFDSEFEVEFFDVEKRAAAMFADWKERKDYENRQEMRDWNNYHTLENHL